MRYMLREADLAEELGVSVWTVRDWRKRRTGPAVTRLGPQSIRYAREDVDTWLRECRETAASTA